MFLAEIRLSPRIGTSELRLDGINAAQSPRSRLLSVARDDAAGTVLVLAGRVYYRSDLKRRWAIELDDDTAIPSDWALAAYRAGAVAALDDLEGEFSLMVYDPRMRVLHLHRSVFGDVPLYWVYANGVVLAGTSLRSLAAQAANWEINQELLAGFLLDPHSFGPSAEATAMNPVRRVLPGTRLSIHAAGKIECTRFWDWTRFMREDSSLGRGEAAERYLELLDDATRERMNGERTAAELSGGFDSSTIVCLARDHLVRGEGRGPLLTVSLDYDFPEMAGEGKYMHLITDQGGPVEPLYLRDGAALDYDGFPHEVPLHDEPSAYLFRFAIDRQMLDLAANWGAHTLLTGGGAELLVEPRLEYLTDLVRGGKWQQSFREAQRWALDRRTTVGALAWQHMVMPFLPAYLQQGWSLFRRGGFADQPSLDRNTIAPWIRPAFASKARMRDQAVESIRWRRRLPAAHSKKLAELESSASNWVGWHLAIQRAGILLSHPFQDPRLLAFGLNLHRDVRQEPGQVKPLLAEATRGILPEPIRRRRYKCGFDRVNIEGFRRALGRIRMFLRDTADCDPDIIDRSQLERAMLAYSQGLGNAVVGNQISAALSLLVWLNQMKDHPPHVAAPAQRLPLAF